MKATALIMAAGESIRFGGELPKQYCKLAGRPLLIKTIESFKAATTIEAIYVVVAPDRVEWVHDEILNPYLAEPITVVAGGKTRQESVLNGLESLAEGCKLVAIHDGARPLVLADDIDRVVNLAAEEGAALLAVPMTDTVKRVEDDRVVATLDRSCLIRAQTPQVFEYGLILEAHRKSKEAGLRVTDDVALLEQAGTEVSYVLASNVNPKITTPEDLFLAETILSQKRKG